MIEWDGIIVFLQQWRFEYPSDTYIDAPDIVLIIEEEVHLYYINFLSSFVQVKKFQDEEIAHSIQICESLLDDTPSTAAIEVFEKFDFSCFDATTPKQDIQTSIVEEKLLFHPTQSFSGDSSILNFVQSLLVTT